MQTLIRRGLGLVSLGSILTTFSAGAGLIFTIENPGVQASTVSGVLTETFDTLPLGAAGPFDWRNGQSLLGSFSPGGWILSSDTYGGAYGGAARTDYYGIGSQSGSTAATLTFSAPKTYFGMWWAAGDALNHLEFYDGGTLLGSYAVGDIIAGLSKAYYGNPNNGLDTGEPFVYLDFTTTELSRITSVKFLNDNLESGFEMDNLSVYDEPINPPGQNPRIGNPVPDGGSELLQLLGTSILLLIARHWVIAVAEWRSWRTRVLKGLVPTGLVAHCRSS